MLARIPEKMVNQALESVQKEFSLCARDPERDLKLPTETFPWVTTSGLAQMAKRYNLPSLVADGGWGKNVEGGISGVMTPSTQLTGIMGGSDIVTGMGSVDSAKGISFEQFIIDCYMWDREKLDLLEMDAGEMPAEANKIVKRLLEKHQVEPLAGELIKKGDDIISRYEDVLGG